jgi:HD-like signal output (HDOD) protein
MSQMPAPDTCAASPATRAADIAAELDRARRSGPLQNLAVPACPELLTRLHATLAEREPDLNEVARIAASDVAMSASLLRVANSPLHAVGQPVQTIGQALNRLGLRHAAAELTRFIAQRTIRVDSPHLRGFWQHAGKRAVAMAHLATRLPGLSPDLAHTCGLFLHVGLPVLLQGMRGYGGTLVEAAARVDRSFIATENANHRTDHAVVGALVARVWKIAPPVVAAIRLHHDLAALGHAGIEPEVHTLVAAGLVAEHLMREHESLNEDSDWPDHAGAALQWLQIDVDELASWKDELEVVFDAT